MAPALRGVRLKPDPHYYQPRLLLLGRSHHLVVAGLQLGRAQLAVLILVHLVEHLARTGFVLGCTDGAILVCVDGLDLRRGCLVRALADAACRCASDAPRAQSAYPCAQRSSPPRSRCRRCPCPSSRTSSSRRPRARWRRRCRRDPRPSSAARSDPSRASFRRLRHRPSWRARRRSPGTTSCIFMAISVHDCVTRGNAIVNGRVP